MYQKVQPKHTGEPRVGDYLTTLKRLSMFVTHCISELGLMVVSNIKII